MDLQFLQVVYSSTICVIAIAAPGMRADAFYSRPIEIKDALDYN